jgi:chemotaxis protein MotA
MSTSTLLGVLFGFMLFLGAIAHETDNYRSFLSLSAFMIIFGGTLSTAFMNYQYRYVLEALKAVINMYKKPPASRESMVQDVMYLIKWAYVVQSKGIIALEQEVKATRIDNPLLKFGADAVATGYEPKKIKEIMEIAVETAYERATVVVDVLKNMAATAPMFGMVGTLVGMVVMLQNMGEDMSKIGKGMAVALLATLYGVVAARMVFLPAALKMEQNEGIVRHRNMMLAEGLVGIAEKQSPRYLQDRLNSYLDPSMHFSIDRQLH